MSRKVFVDVESATLFLVKRSYGAELHLNFRHSLSDNEIQQICDGIVGVVNSNKERLTFVVEEEGNNKPKLSMESLQKLMDVFGKHGKSSNLRCSVIKVSEIDALVKVLFGLWQAFFTKQENSCPVLLTDNDDEMHDFLINPR